MAKSKKNKKPSVKVEDLSAKKDPKGGATDIFAKLGDIKGESALKVGAAGLKVGSKIETTTLSSADFLYSKLK